MNTDPQSRGGEAGNVAEDVLARDPKSLEKRDLPEPLPLKKILGPGIIAVGVSMAAGEFILWPFITSIAGLGLLWVAVAALASQVFINTEIERYTLATGETAVTGFARFWKPWGCSSAWRRSSSTPGPAGRPAPRPCSRSPWASARGGWCP